MAGATTLGDLASAIGARTEESAVIAALKAGSEEAYSWLIGEFHQPIYGLIYRIVNDPSDAADTTQEVFLKVFRGMKHFHGESSLKTWIYRIALHEAANRRRWWFRHKAQETPIDPVAPGDYEFSGDDRLVDPGSLRLSSLRTRRCAPPWSSLCGKCPSPIGLLWFCAISRNVVRTNRGRACDFTGNSEVAHHARARPPCARFGGIRPRSGSGVGADPPADECAVASAGFHAKVSGKLPWRQRG